MKNKYLFNFQSKVVLEVKGKNIERFIHKLSHNKIELFEIKYLKDSVQIKIKKDDYPKVLELKSIYEINVIDAFGIIKLKKVISVNKFIISAIVFGVVLLLFLTNIIFNVEVIHNSGEVRTFLLNELKDNGLKQLSIKKNFKQINEIKNKILTKYPDKIEWLEIETVGTKYVVRVELREIPNDKEQKVKRHVVAKKDAVIKRINAIEGMVVKEVNNYVKKGDIIISGNILLNEEIKGSVPAKGEVYGEVWYTLTVEYPFTYYEERLTGKTKNVISFKFLNKSFDLFSSFKNKKVTEKKIIQNSLLPIRLVLEQQQELEVIDQVLTEEEAIDKAILLGQGKMKMGLKDKEHVVSHKVLKVNIKEDKVVVDVFFVVYENITDYQEIIMVEDDQVEKNA